MIYKKLRDFYNVDTISQDKGWLKIINAVKDINEPFEIDFTGINVVDPWDLQNFKQLLKNPFVNMKFTNNEEIVSKIKMLCILDGLDESRIVNEEVELPRVKTSEEKKIEKYGTDLIPYFKNRGEVYEFDVTQKYSQMHSTNTLNYIRYAIDRIAENGNSNFLINIGTVSIQPNVLKELSEMIVKYNSEGITLNVNLENEEDIKNMGLLMHKSTENFDELKKADFFRNNSSKLIGMVGLLLKYKKSRTVDEFGRHGKGEIISSRIAVITDVFMYGTDTATICVDSYNDNYFYTKQQWIVEHDNEEPDCLHKDSLEIDSSQLGFHDLFLGSKYHFLKPLQKDLSENRKVIIGINSDGTNKKKICTIPERIKIVFDDWGVEYNKELLDEYIEQTNNKLRYNK